MAFVLADNVRETTTTEGTGTVNLGGTVTGAQSFVSGVGSTNTTYYALTDGIDFEVGIGTVTSGSPDTLSRDVIISSSNGGAAVDWGTGTRNVFCTMPGSKVWHADNDGAGSGLDADMLDGIHASTVAVANQLIALDNDGELPANIKGNAATADNASNANAVNGISANIIATADELLALDTNSHLPASTVGSISHATDTSTVSTTHTRQVNASSNGCRAQEMRSQINACNTNCTASGQSSQINVSEECLANFPRSQINASLRVKTGNSNSVTGGFALSGLASTANRTWEIQSSGGVGIFEGGTNTGPLSDIAEYMPNITGQAIPLGTLLTLDGNGVRPANNEPIIGVVSATAGVVLGDSPFNWQGRYLTGDYGEQLYEDILDPDWAPDEGQTESDRPTIIVSKDVLDPDWAPGEGQTESDRPTITIDQNIPDPDWIPREGQPESDRPIITVRKENLNWDPNLPQAPRSERPDEWTLTGLIGQVYVTVDSTVAVNDYLEAVNGIGTKSTSPTNCRVMKITKLWDGTKAIAYCLLK